MDRAEIEKLLSEDYPVAVLRIEWEESRISLFRDAADDIEQLRAVARQCLALLDRAEAAERDGGLHD